MPTASGIVLAHGKCGQLRTRAMESEIKAEMSEIGNQQVALAPFLQVQAGLAPIKFKKPSFERPMEAEKQKQE